MTHNLFPTSLFIYFAVIITKLNTKRITTDNYIDVNFTVCHILSGQLKEKLIAGLEWAKVDVFIV